MKDARHAARLDLEYPPSVARAIAGALSPEAEQAEVPKTSGRILAEDARVQIDITAADLPSLRASVNSHLRWADAAARAARMAE